MHTLAALLLFQETFLINKLCLHYSMLQKREHELRRRREHVEKLLKWHQRLDGEEQEVLKMERMIMFISTSDVYQTTSHEQINDTVEITMHRRHHKRTNIEPDEASIAHAHSLTNVTDTITMAEKRFHQKKQKQIRQIEQSLNTLKMISSQSISSDEDGSNGDNNVVEISGRQLNKLWKRLTGIHEEKYVPEMVYILSKADLEQLYEQAKSVVLNQFCTNEEFKRRLVDQSIVDTENGSNLISQPVTEINDSAKSEHEHEPIVPTLNLTSSSEPRENIISDTDPGYYFSNSINENNTEQNDDQEQEQLKSHTDTVVEALASDATTQNEDESQIQTEEQIEEEDEIQSDITEDSLNKPLQFTNGNADTSEIQTVPETESCVNESDRSSQIPSAIENERTSEAQTQDMNENSTQLIEETSFPEIDIPSVNASSVAEEISATKLSSTEEQNYTSDNFEEKNDSNDVTTNSTATTTKIPTSTPPTATTASSTTTNQITENISAKSNEQSSIANDMHPKELEQRLILIGDGLRDLSEAISQSPVLQSEITPEENDKSVNSASSVTEDLEASEYHSGAEDATESSNATTKNETSMENEVTPKMESDESTDSIAVEIAAANTDHSIIGDTTATKRPFQYTLSGGSIDYNKVPEADALKRAPIPMETEVC